MKSWKESGWAGRLKLVVFSLLPVLVLLAMAEFLASLTIYRDISVEPDPLAGGGAVYRMHFGRAWWGKTSETPLNSHGFPDREFSEVGPKGDCKHLVFAGDSFTFGDAVDGHRSFVSLLRRALQRAHPDRCIRVFNLGERMTTIDRHAEHVLSTLEVLDPDVVVLGLYQNDLTDLANPGSPAYVPPDSAAAPARWWGDVMRSRVPFNDASLVRFLSYHAFAFLITRDIKYDVLSQWSILEDPSNRATAERLTTIYRSVFSDLVSNLHSAGVEVGALILPSKLDILAGRSPEEALFMSVAEDVDVPSLSLFPVLNESRNPYPYQMYDGHLSDAGNRAVASSVFDWLFPDDASASPFTALRDL